jgi:DNA-binding protein H-NS
LNGQGDMPTWLTAACNAGVNPEFFRIELGPTPRILLYPRQFELFG